MLCFHNLYSVFTSQTITLLLFASLSYLAKSGPDLFHLCESFNPWLPSIKYLSYHVNKPLKIYIMELWPQYLCTLNTAPCLIEYFMADFGTQISI